MTQRCLFCDKEFETKLSYVKRGQGKFCSRTCKDNDSKKQSSVSCGTCHSQIIRSPSELSKAEIHFCNNTCKSNWQGMPSGQNHPRWKGGAASYRERARKKYGRFCSNPNCQLQKSGIEIPPQMFDVDHIDGDRTNNDIQNLQILCVWCHALKTRL